LLHEEAGLGVAGLLGGRDLGFALAAVGHGVGFGALVDEMGLGLLGLAVELGVGFMLGRLALDHGLGDGRGTQAFELHCCALFFYAPLQLCVAVLRRTVGCDLLEVQLAGDGDFAGAQLLVGVGLLDFALGLEDSGVGVDFGDALLGLAFLFGLADAADHAGVGDVDLGLRLGAFVGFAGEGFEVLGLAHVLQFLDVGVVDAQAELVEFLLDAFDDLGLEEAAVVEELFHGHVGDDGAGLALDDAFDDVLDVVAAGCDGGRAVLCADLAVGVTCQEDGVLFQGRLVIVRADGEDGWDWVGS
jgi:hypothetical protein